MQSIMAKKFNTRPDPTIFENIIDSIGWTPLVRLRRVIPTEIKTKIYAKLEYLNPGGSVKDRVGVYMIQKAEQARIITPGMTIVEPSSGNTGVGLAIAAAQKGYKLVITMPDKMSVEKVRLLEAYGAEVVICPTAVEPDDPRSYYRMAETIAKERNGWVPNQYANPANPEIHYLSTGPEIWKQTGGKITHLVTSVGTGGTITGCARFLKEKSRDIKVIGCDPVGSILTEAWSNPDRSYKASLKTSYKLEGAGEDFIPATLDLDLIDKMLQFTDQDGFTMSRRLAKEEGILTGGTGGAAVHCTLKMKNELKPSDIVVIIFPDSGRNYISKMFNDEWMIKNGFKV